MLYLKDTIGFPVFQSRILSEKRREKVGKDADRQRKCVCDMITMLGGFREEAACFLFWARECSFPDRAPEKLAVEKKTGL